MSDNCRMRWLHTTCATSRLAVEKSCVLLSCLVSSKLAFTPKADLFHICRSPMQLPWRWLTCMATTATSYVSSRCGSSGEVDLEKSWKKRDKKEGQKRGTIERQKERERERSLRKGHCHNTATGCRKKKIMWHVSHVSTIWWDMQTNSRLGCWRAPTPSSKGWSSEHLSLNCPQIVMKLSWNTLKHYRTVLHTAVSSKGVLRL